MWDIRTTVHSKGFAVAAASVTSLVVSSYATYTWTRKKLETEFEERLAKEVEETKEFYSRLHKTGDFATPESALKTLHPELEEESALLKEAVEAMREYNLDLPQDSEVAFEEGTVIEGNIFVEQPISLWDQEREEKGRTPLAPYIISREEFFANEPEHEQVHFSYFEGDGALADENDEHIPDIDAVVGDDNMIKFGYGSGDENTVYIRNERINLDIEVVRTEGKYAHMVLGLEHSDDSYRHGVRKFKKDFE